MAKLPSSSKDEPLRLYSQSRSEQMLRYISSMCIRTDMASLCSKTVCQALLGTVFLHMGLTLCTPWTLFAIPFTTQGCLDAANTLFGAGEDKVNPRYFLKLSVGFAALCADLIMWGTTRKTLFLVVLILSHPNCLVYCYNTILWHSFESFIVRSGREIVKRAIAFGMSAAVNHIYLTSFDVDAATTWVTFMPYAKSTVIREFVKGMALTTLLRYTEARYIGLTPALRYLLRRRYIFADSRLPDMHVSSKQGRAVLLTIAVERDWSRLHSPEVLRVLTKLHVQHGHDRFWKPLASLSADLQLRSSRLFCLWTIGELACHTEQQIRVATNAHNANSALIVVIAMIAAQVRINSRTPKIYSIGATSILLYAPQLYPLVALSLVMEEAVVFVYKALRKSYESGAYTLLPVDLARCVLFIACMGYLSNYAIAHCVLLTSVALSLSLRRVQQSKQRGREASGPQDLARLREWVYI